MSEPKSRASKVESILPGVLHWHLHDDRIDWRSDAFAVQEEGKTILIDPLPLEESAVEELGRVEAICLTGACHQRSAWRYRKQFGVKVYAPAGARTLEEEPDVSYREGDRLPGGLVAVHAPGPVEEMYVFHLERAGVLFCADILINDKGKIGFVPDKYMDDPRRTRETARRFLDLGIQALCFAHGEPLKADPHAAIRKALEGEASS